MAAFARLSLAGFVSTIVLVAASGTAAHAAARANHPPNVPTDYDTSPHVPCEGGFIGNTSIAFFARISDPDGSQDTLAARFTIVDDTSHNTVAAVTMHASNGLFTSLRLESDEFTDQHAYSWNVSVYDGHEASAPTPTCRFEVVHRQPLMPTVDSPTFPPNRTGPPIRTPGTFTFTPGVHPDPAKVDLPLKYVYSLNDIPPVNVPDEPGPFPGGWMVLAAGDEQPTTVTIIPARVGPNTLYVYGIDRAGNPGPSTHYSFSVAAPSRPDPYGDVTGDGRPDLLEIGPPNRPGLWLHPGLDDEGHVGAAVQVGAAGLGRTTGDDAVADWVGTSVVVTDYDRDSFQDVVVRMTNTGPEGNVRALRGTGDGRPFSPIDRDQFYLNRVDGQPGFQVVDQLAAQAGSLVGTPDRGLPPDLYAVVGDTLYLYPASLPPGAYYDPQPLSTGWRGHTITATTVNGSPALYSRDDATGEVDLWVGDTANGVPAGSDGSNPKYGAGTRTVKATSGFDAARTPVIMGTVVNGAPLLWAVTASGTVEAHRFD